MRVLVACEESQAVTSRLRKKGITAFSCDLLPTSGRHPEWHIQADALEVVKLDWDMVIAFPPCTHLASSGAAWFDEKKRNGLQYLGIGFFLAFTTLDHVPRVAIENPIGIMSNVYRKPDQIIQPWQFGDPARKATCLWLKGLPLLQATEIVEPEVLTLRDGKSYPKWHVDTFGMSPHERSVQRSKTYPGIAQAMADQWGKEVFTCPIMN